MTIKFWVIVFFVSCSGILTGCSEDEPFSSFSDMVAGRQQVRREISDKNAGEQNKQMGSDSIDTDQNQNAQSAETLSFGQLFEKKIEILDAQSNLPLAKGIAFLDKQGRIVRIKITR